MDIVVSPTTVAFNTQLGTPNLVFQAGEVIDALVVQLLDSGMVRLSIGDALVDVKTQVPLVPGTTVRLAVKNTPEGIRLTILDPTTGDGTSASAALRPSAAQSAGIRSNAPPSPAGTGAGASGVDRSETTLAAALRPATPPGTPDPATPSPAMALTQAVKIAAVRQGGLAPLFADLAVVAETTANMAASGAAAAPVGVRPAPTAGVSGGPPGGSPGSTAAAVAAGVSTARSVSPSAAAIAALPEPVRQAAARLLALRLPVDAEISADDVRQAFTRSGLLLEARIAAAAAPAASAPDISVAEDLKAALAVFRQIVKTWLDSGPGAEPVRTDGAPPLPNVKASPSIVPTAAAAAAAADAGSETQAARAPAVAGPPPPYRGAPPAAPPPVAHTFPADATTRDIGVRLLADTDAALSRQTLLQAASLPDAPAIQPSHADPAGPRWSFEVPFVAPQGTAIAQFEIARDGRAAPAEGIKPVWRARFTLDVEPMGPVHAQIALVGERTTVTLWAERAGSAAQLRDNTALLADALKQAELDPGGVTVRDGAPPRPRENASPGRFLDRAS